MVRPDAIPMTQEFDGKNLKTPSYIEVPGVGKESECHRVCGTGALETLKDLNDKKIMVKVRKVMTMKQRKVARSRQVARMQD